MTTQGDPNRRRPDDYLRRDDAGRWGIGAVVGVLAVAAILGFLIFGLGGDRTGDPVTPRSPGANAPTTTTPPATTPPATTPKQP
jgi:hypothetical protein